VLAQAGEVTLHTKTYPLTSALDAGNVRGRAILVP
jgi:NAD+-dependent secondary alcohol dehydrogenase Adh1